MIISRYGRANNHPEEIHSESFLRSKLNYIHENPVRAGLVAGSAPLFVHLAALQLSNGKRLK